MVDSTDEILRGQDFDHPVTIVFGDDLDDLLRLAKHVLYGPTILYKLLGKCMQNLLCGVEHRVFSNGLVCEKEVVIELNGVCSVIGAVLGLGWLRSFCRILCGKHLDGRGHFIAGLVLQLELFN